MEWSHSSVSRIDPPAELNITIPPAFWSVISGRTLFLLSTSVRLYIHKSQVNVLSPCDLMTMNCNQVLPGRQRCPTRRRQRDCLIDRKSTRLNSSHLGISYAVFCL